MERRGGCCIALYGGGGDADAAWKVGRIMLRFRPIAPRPAAGAGSLAIAPAPAEACAPARRPKRKGSANPGGGGRGRKPRKVEATAVSPSSSSKDDEKSSSSSTTTSSSTIVTLPLIPETPERKDEPAESPKQFPGPTAAAVVPCVAPAWMAQGEGGGAGVAAATRPVRAVGSWVTVECVTGTWTEGEVAWRSDGAVRAALAADECPGFVSDAWDRVTWANEAYRRMVVGSSGEVGGGREAGEGQVEEEVGLGLVTRGSVPAAGACRAFTCMVRVRHARWPGSGTRSSSLAAPCDVWRLDSGGCAWRLDVKAALSLSL